MKMIIPTWKTEHLESNQKLFQPKIDELLETVWRDCEITPQQLSREFRDTADVFYFQSSAPCQVDNTNEEVSNELPSRYSTVASVCRYENSV